MSDADEFEYEPISKRWRFKEHRDGDVASWSMGSFSAFVQDMDGDATYWLVKRGETVLGKGTIYNLDDWSRGLKAAEDCLIEHGALYRPDAQVKA